MALQFILGSAGSGKSHYVYEHIIKLSKENSEQVFFVVVPEQFTMQTQRELVSRQENHGIMNIDVVSFQRLAYRIFDELGLTQIKVLEETGKNFVLRKVAEDKKEQLRILKGSMKKTGYINEIKSVISELAQYRIQPKQLQELVKEESLPAPFRYRIHDIKTIYEGFQDYLKGNYITAEEILEVLAEEAERSEILKDCVLVLDGFTGFTPVQYALLEQLMECARDVYVTVTLDEGEDFAVCEGMQELFYMSKKTINTLSRIAMDHHIEIAEPVRLRHGTETRFSQAEPLGWLEQNLFRKEVGKYGKKNVEDYLFLCSLTNPRQELLYLAGEINRLIREEGYRYQDIAVVCGDVELYGNYMSEIFDTYEIPYFLDKKKNIAFHSFTEMIKAALQILEQDFSYESVMGYLRCGLSTIPREEIDLLENYLLANKIRGFRNWQDKWIRLAGIQNMEELDAVNGIREKLLQQFREMQEVFTEKSSNVLAKTVSLYRFVVSLDIEKQLERRRILLEQEGKLALAKEYAQIYKIVMDLLDKLTQLLAEENMSVKEYREVLEAGFAASSVGIIPPGYDRVLVGDIERTRLPDIKILFFVGVNDGLIPKAEKQGGLISQQERQVFESYNMELAPGVREKSFIQKFYLYLNLTKPSQKLYITWFSVDKDGKEARKSYLIGTLQRMFPLLRVQRPDMESSKAQLVTPQSSRRFFIEELGKAREGNISQDFIALLQWYRSQESWNEKVEELLKAAFYTYEKKAISPEVTRELYGKVLENSVTRLERFASCAYGHFMAYGIGIKERQLGEFAPVDMGSMFHEALERYARKMQDKGYQWGQVTKEVQEQMIEEAVSETVEELGYMLYQDARTAYTMQRILRILKRTVETIDTQIAQSNFTPEGYEVSFSFAEDMKAVNFSLSEEEKMRLRGRIDRVDTREEGNKLYVKVVDYKSGNNQFSLLSLYHGLQLQLVVYLNAATEILKKKYPGKEVLPAGMYYYHIDDPVIEIKGEPSELEIKEKILEQLQLKGVGTDDADESVSRKSQKTGTDQIQILSDFVNTKIRHIGRDIYKGDIGINPYMMKDKTGCDYCPYHGICGFDQKLPGHGYRKIQDEKNQEVILEKMRKEVLAEYEIHQGTTTGY